MTTKGGRGRGYCNFNCALYGNNGDVLIGKWLYNIFGEPKPSLGFFWASVVNFLRRFIPSTRCFFPRLPPPQPFLPFHVFYLSFLLCLTWEGARDKARTASPSSSSPQATLSLHCNTGNILNALTNVYNIKEKRKLFPSLSAALI